MWSGVDACLKCTLCITQCPVVSVNSDFPGPKALGPEWYRQKQRGGVATLPHVDDCTFCQLCEAACPVEVPIAHLIALHKAAATPPLRIRVRDGILARPHRAARWTRWAGTSRVMRKVGGISGKTSLPRLRRARWSPSSLGQPLGPCQGRVGLFVDCYSAGYDGEVVEQASQLLTLWGFNVTLMPQGSHCCGAAAYAAGKPQLAEREARETWSAMGRFQDVDFLVTLNATCDATLRDEWPDYFGIEPPMPVVPFDEMALRAPQEFWNRLGRVSSSAEVRIMTHTTCRGQVARGDGHLGELAHRAGFHRVEPSDAPCCGAAGAYAFKIEHEDTAQQLVARLVEQSSHVRPQGIFTDSGTCALHIEQATQVKTRHPAYWLYRQYLEYQKGEAP